MTGQQDSTERMFVKHMVGYVVDGTTRPAGSISSIGKGKKTEVEERTNMCTQTKHK